MTEMDTEYIYNIYVVLPTTATIPICLCYFGSIIHLYGAYTATIMAHIFSIRMQRYADDADTESQKYEHNFS